MDESLGTYVGGVLGLLILILDVIAIFEILQSGRPVFEKLLWILAIVVFPILGCVLYYFCSGREHYHSREPVISS